MRTKVPESDEPPAVSVRLMSAVAAGLCLAWLASMAYAQPAVVSCPPTLSAESRVLAPPPGWEVGYEEVTYPLAGVTFFDGAPSERASLVPNKETRQTKTSTSLWRFPPNDGRGYWISCSYDNSNAVLFRRLADSIAECRVTYDRKVKVAGLPEVKQIDCK